MSVTCGEMHCRTLVFICKPRDLLHIELGLCAKVCMLRRLRTLRLCEARDWLLEAA